MLRYEHIEYLNFLFGIPVLLIAMLLFNKWRNKSLALFGDNKLVKELMHSHSKRKNQIKSILTVLIFTSLIIGIANPQIGTKIEEVKREGVDLMIAIDLSNSMLAEDIKPNRLERAKLAISKLIDKLEGDRIGLIVFAGEAYVQLPITTDYSAAKLFLSTVNTNIVPTQGTEIAKAIDLSVKSFDMENAQNKAIIIITDGESKLDLSLTYNTTTANGTDLTFTVFGNDILEDGAYIVRPFDAGAFAFATPQKRQHFGISLGVEF